MKVDSDKDGIIYVDDFEGSASSFRSSTARDSMVSWQVCRKMMPKITIRSFPEVSREYTGLVTGANRARFNWYRIDPECTSRN